MNKAILFNFDIDKENNKIKVERFFNAPIELVWDAWTDPEILDRWWAPKPYLNQTKSMDFKEGGCWHYSMISPENQIHWSRFDYKKIKLRKSFTGLDAFCDEVGNINTDFSRMHWEILFNETDEQTIVNITISVETWETLAKIIEMGFKEGFTMGLNQLSELLIILKKEQK